MFTFVYIFIHLNFYDNIVTDLVSDVRGWVCDPAVLNLFSISISYVLVLPLLVKIS